MSLLSNHVASQQIYQMMRPLFDNDYDRIEARNNGTADIYVSHIGNEYFDDNIEIEFHFNIAKQCYIIDLYFPDRLLASTSPGGKLYGSYWAVDEYNEITFDPVERTLTIYAQSGVEITISNIEL